MRMKKKRHGSERIALLSSLVVENPTSLSENLNEVYGNTNSLRIEIGCGKGDFIEERAFRSLIRTILLLKKYPMFAQ